MKVIDDGGREWKGMCTRIEIEVEVKVEIVH